MNTQELFQSIATHFAVLPSLVCGESRLVVELGYGYMYVALDMYGCLSVSMYCEDDYVCGFEAADTCWSLERIVSTFNEVSL